MKIRTDFVTNSSSSSFICEICKYETSGYDMSLSEAGMVCCENGHIFCEEHLLLPSRDELIKRAKKRNKIDNSHVRFLSDLDILYMWIIEDGSHYDIPQEYCPICQMTCCTETDMLKYLLKEAHLDEEAILKTWKKRFGNYDKLKEYLLEKKDES